MRASSFKAQYRRAPPRPDTPPAPVWEPLSPVLRPHEAPAAHPTGASNGDAQTSAHPIADPLHLTPAQRAPGRAPLQLSPPSGAFEPSLRSAPLPQRGAPFPPALGSPIEALADAAVSLHAKPSYIESARPSSQLPASPAAAAHLPRQRAPKHAQHLDAGYAYDERPAKRARSEYFSSPQYGQHYSRPATSHIPSWSYNVEQMADNSTRMYQDTPATPQHQDENSLKRLSDAQLLLDFAAEASSSTPRHPSTTKRWSISHPEAPYRYPQQHVDSSSPYAGALHAQNAQSRQLPPPPEFGYAPEPSSTSPRRAFNTLAGQTHTPPAETPSGVLSPTMNEGGGAEDMKPKKQQGWPKGKPRGPRNSTAGGKKKRSTPRPKGAPSANAPEASEQLHSPQSLPGEYQDGQPDAGNVVSERGIQSHELPSRARRHSFSTTAPSLDSNDALAAIARAQSVPLGSVVAITPPADDAHQPKRSAAEPVTICAGCGSSDSDTMIGDGEQWIRCDGCREWYHFVCAGFKSEREVRDVDKFYCVPCQPKFGETTKVRKSARAHTAVDYAGLNEGILKTSDDNPEHHYISAFKNGDIEFATETFARVPPEIVSADFLEKTNGFKEPILIPAALNPRPKFPGTNYPRSDVVPIKTDDSHDQSCSYEMVPDDGQDKLDMVIPEGLTVRRVSELYGPQERVPVIDVKAQEGEDKRWTMAKWADYYEQQGEKPVRNVISLEVSRSQLGRLIRRPRAVRDMDLQDSVWREDDKKAPPAVQFYCLMSVADCYTDFHIDFGGSSVYYHIVKGKKVFFFIPPTKQNLKKYEDWCLSPRQSHEFLGHQVKECYRVDLYPGDTMLIPSGWIHAVWTPEDSLVIGGNFLTRIHYGMQIKVLEIEKNTKVAPKFRYPFFQKIMWLSLIRYLEEDPLPESVEQLFLSGRQYPRDVPIYCETDRFGHNSHLSPQNYNRRYYSKAELEGLPDLANYIWRTVLISLGRIEGITETVKKAVTSSIPKNFGDPLVLARRFAIWIAWKRGNENIPSWAYPDATLPEAADAEKKLSVAQVKRMEREAWGEVLRATAERQSSRVKSTESPRSNGVDSQTSTLPPAPPPMLTGFLQKSDPTRPLTTPKTSQLGPKRIACDACRKRRIRCKHKDELIETAKSGNGMNGGLNTIDLSGSLGLSVKRRYSDLDGTYGQQTNSTDNAAIPNGGPLLADVNADPYALKSGRVKACADCRKSKRRCIHDEFGNIDPVKANEVPIPRGAASKKRRISEEDPSTVNRKIRTDGLQGEVPNGALRHRNSLPSGFGMPSSELQDLAYSARQALNQVRPEPVALVDPALPSFGLGGDSIAGDASRRPPHQDAVLSSIETVSDGPLQDVPETARSERLGPSVEPLTPGPMSDDVQDEPNGVKQDLVRPTDNDTAVVAPPRTPNAPRSSGKGSSGRKTSQTPRPPYRKSNTPKSTPGGRRCDSKESTTVEPRSEQKARAVSSVTGESEEDMASLALAMQLQMEEHGLRRRSK